MSVEGAPGPTPLLFRPKWGLRAAKKFLETVPTPPPPPPPPRIYLRVWMTGWIFDASWCRIG